MKYEQVFKTPYLTMFIKELFLPSYGQLNPVVKLQNETWEFFLSEKTLKDMSEHGFRMALEEGRFKKFKDNYQPLLKKANKLKKTKIKKISDEKFILFLREFKQFANDFFEIYRETEFFYFKKVEAQLNDYCRKTKHSLEEVLSKKVDLAKWPEEKRKLAKYIISMQHLKFKYRKLQNSVSLGPNSVLAEILRQIIARTKREDSRSMVTEEIERCLRGENVKDCSDRSVCSFITWDKKKRKMIILTGEKARKKIKELDKEMPKNEVTGTVASKGFARGKARVIIYSMNPEKYLHKFQKGEILVSTTTGPEMVVIMKKAAAIVTDEGGLMSHAAIVSRELKVPCVVGTKCATDVFKDGDLIEVDANTGVVRKI